MFQDWLVFLLGTLEGFFDLTYQPLVNAFRPLAVAIMTTYILIVAIMIFTGKADKPKQMLWTCFVASIITTIVFSADIYKSWIIEPVVKTSFNLQGYFLSQNGSQLPKDIFQTVDSVFAHFFSKLQILSSKAGLLDGFKISIVTFLLAMVIGAVYILFALLVITSIFALYVFFMIGGITLYLAIMPNTRFIFWAWCRAVISYALIPVFASIVMAISLSAIAIVAGDLKFKESDIFNETVGAAFLVGFLAIYFLFKCQEFAAALTGAQPSGVGGLTGSALAIGATSAQAAGKYGVPVLNAGRKGVQMAGSAAATAIKDAYTKLRGL